MIDYDRFDTVIRRRGSQTIASMPQLGLYGSGADVSSALAELEARKKELNDDLAAGVVDASQVVIAPPAARVEGRSARKELGVFTLKIGIVLFLLISSGVLVADLAATKAKSLKIGGSEFWGKIEQELSRAASSSSGLPEEKKAKLLSDMRAVANKWRPFVREAVEIFSLEKNAGDKAP